MRGFVGNDTVMADANVRGSSSATLNIHVRVTKFNSEPEMGDDNAVTDEDTPVSIPVLENDWDSEGDTLGFDTLWAYPLHSKAEWNPASRAFIYTPDKDYHGPDSLSYIARDGHEMARGIAARGVRNRTLAYVHVYVRPVNDGPRPAKHSLRIYTDCEADIFVLLTDYDVDQDRIELDRIEQPARLGTAQLGSQNTWIRYTSGRQAGEDVFTYLVRDEYGAYGEGSFNVTVTVLPRARGRHGSRVPEWVHFTWHVQPGDWYMRVQPGLVQRRLWTVPVPRLARPWRCVRGRRIRRIQRHAHGTAEGRCECCVRVDVKQCLPGHCAGHRDHNRCGASHGDCEGDGREGCSG
jgi:hypothetical protein